MIFSFVNFDKCRKEIARMEEARNSNGPATRHPKEFKQQSLDVLRCHANNLYIEPVCLDAFNDAWDSSEALRTGSFPYWRSYSSDMPNRDALHPGASYDAAKKKP